MLPPVLLLLRSALAIWGLVVPYKFRIYFYFKNITIGILWITLSGIDIFTILILLIYECRVSFCLFVSASIFYS